MIFTITLWLILAIFVAWAVFLDLKRAEERRVIRERRRLARTRPVELFIHADISGFVAKMQQAAREMADLYERTPRLARPPRIRVAYPTFTLMDELSRPCWRCRVLSWVGLSAHARHYHGRHV